MEKQTRQHTRDLHCERDGGVDVDGYCKICNVGASDCSRCHGVRYHEVGCWASDASYRVLDTAMEEVFKVFADNFPEIKTGDFPPDEQSELMRALSRALLWWYRFNDKEAEDWREEVRLALEKEGFGDK